ncbi:hypothetical protein BGZ75_002005 [Mortierella antarctica]|nr:hypothetical protein BGZ75_002005 [Mortierella antarctica]
MFLWKNEAIKKPTGKRRRVEAEDGSDERPLKYRRLRASGKTIQKLLLRMEEEKKEQTQRRQREMDLEKHKDMEQERKKQAER